MKFLIAGLGSIGRRHLRNLITLGEDDIVLYRTGKSSLPDEELEHFPIEFSLEAALGHEPDAVIVSNPTAMHLDVAIPAARQGCHLLIEKPVSHSTARIEELREAVEAQGVKVLVGFQFRFHPGIQAVKEAITESKIGRPFYVSAHWGEHLPGWHPWEDYRNSYAARQDLGGGVALTLCHPFDYLRWIFGAVESVMAQVDQLGPWDIPVEDHVNALLDFKLGLRGCVHLDYIQRPPEHSLKILGTEGTILWDNADGAAHISRADGEGWQSVPLHKGFERNDLFVEEMRHFLRVVAEGENPRCDLRDGIEALRIVEAVKAASQYGKRLFMADFPSSASSLDK